MQMNPNIILAGQGVNALGALDAGTQAAANTNELARANALTRLYQQQGAGIANGDEGALNALAAFDPAAALGVRETHLGMDARRQEMGFAQERMDLARQAGARQAAAQAAQMSAAEVAEERARISRGLSTAIPALRAGDLGGVNQVLGAAGLGPVGSLDDAASVIAQYEGALEHYEAAQAVLGGQAGPELTTAMQTLDQRARAAGLEPGTPEYQAFILNGGPERAGTSLTVAPDGTVRMTQGNVAAQEEGRLNPSSPGAMISTIDGILNDPALDTATGILSPLQNIPGTPQYRFGTRADQLQGQAFLQAFESLKGGGQITEIEGQQATRAIGRLDTAQSANDYRDALLELRGLLEQAQSRPLGWADAQAQPTAQSGVPAMPSDLGWPQDRWERAWERMTPEERALFQ